MTQRKAERRVEAWRLCTRKHWHQPETLNEFDATCFQCTANEDALIAAERAALEGTMSSEQDKRNPPFEHDACGVQPERSGGLGYGSPATRPLPLSWKIAEALREYDFATPLDDSQLAAMADIIDRAGVGELEDIAQMQTILTKTWADEAARIAAERDALQKEIGYQMQQDGRVIAGLQSDNTVLAHRIEAADRWVKYHPKLGYENKRLLLRILRGED